MCWRPIGGKVARVQGPAGPDVVVTRIDAVWSGLKLVIRKEKRP